MNLATIMSNQLSLASESCVRTSEFLPMIIVVIVVLVSNNILFITRYSNWANDRTMD